jgi:hypothetical protein
MPFQISDERAENAFTALRSTDEKLGLLKANVARTEYLAKLHEAKVFLTSTGTMDERKAQARVAAEGSWQEHFSEIAAYESLKATREDAAILLELYRTSEASIRQRRL